MARYSDQLGHGIPEFNIYASYKGDLWTPLLKVSGLMDYLHHVTSGISILGVLVIIFGVLSGMGRFLRSEVSAACGLNVESARRQLRQVLGYYLLLGLEFLIAADIIDTLMKPTSQDLIVLGAIVTIRTVISYSLNAELAHGSSHSKEAATP